MALMLAEECAVATAIRTAPDHSRTLLFVEATEIPDLDSRLAWCEGLGRSYKLGHYDCVVVVPGSSYQLIQADLSELSEADRRDAARWQIRENLDYPPEQAVVDVFDVLPFSGERKSLNYVVASPAAPLKQLVRAGRDKGLALSAIDIPEFSLRNLCCSFRDERGTAILWLADHHGMLAIVRDQQLYLARSFNTGMNDLRPYADGEYELLSEQLDAIVLEIQRSFDFCESSFSLPMVSRLIVAQCGEDIPAVCHYLNEYLATQVEPLNWADLITLDDDLAGRDLNPFLLAIGGAMRQEQDS